MQIATGDGATNGQAIEPIGEIDGIRGTNNDEEKNMKT